MLLASVLSSCGQTINPYSNAIIAAAANIPIAQKAQTKKFAMFNIDAQANAARIYAFLCQKQTLAAAPDPPSANIKCYNIF